MEDERGIAHEPVHTICSVLDTPRVVTSMDGHLRYTGTAPGIKETDNNHARGRTYAIKCLCPGFYIGAVQYASTCTCFATCRQCKPRYIFRHQYNLYQVIYP